MEYYVDAVGQYTPQKSSVSDASGLKAQTRIGRKTLQFLIQQNKRADRAATQADRFQQLMNQCPPDKTVGSGNHYTHGSAPQKLPWSENSQFFSKAPWVNVYKIDMPRWESVTSFWQGSRKD
ncbi:hypothetical protein D3C85_1398080 [compost metagenome]